MELQPIEIHSKIYEIKGRRVMLDFDLAEMYGVETAQLKRAVRRNIERFEGDDFMFMATIDDLSRCQIGTLNKGRGSNIKYLPFAFTELGVAMLSSVINSNTAIYVNRRIMRAFVTIREYLLSRASESVEIAQLKERVLMLEQIVGSLTEDVQTGFGNLYNAIDELSIKPPQLDANRRMIGYKRGDE
jgi:hypothetical protein